MSLVYLADGYNIIRSEPRFDHRQLRGSRSLFFSYLERYRPQGSSKNRLIVVFDSKADSPDFPQSNLPFEVVFSSGVSADDKIKSMVYASKHPKAIVVVTDDKGLRRAVRSQGAQAMSCQDFLDKGKAGAKGAKSVEPDCKSELNIVERENITDELSRIWLKKK